VETEIVFDPTLQQYVIKVNGSEIDRAANYAAADGVLFAYLRRFGAGAFIPDTDTMPTPHAQAGNRPLLAQCAAVLDACLGGPVVGGGILDELRRVRAELKKAGW
jgi:hypothetical protein